MSVAPTGDPTPGPAPAPAPAFAGICVLRSTANFVGNTNIYTALFAELGVSATPKDGATNYDGSLILVDDAAGAITGGAFVIWAGTETEVDAAVGAATRAGAGAIDDVTVPTGFYGKAVEDLDGATVYVVSHTTNAVEP
jgi:hypothetical protein